MRFPKDVRESVAKKYLRNRASWLAVADPRSEPVLSISLQPPASRSATGPEYAQVTKWLSAWREADTAEPWHVEVEERRWTGLGPQKVPARVEIRGCDAAARVAGQSEQWELLKRRVLEARQLLAPASSREVWARKLGTALADVLSATHADYERALRVTAWLIANPSSGLLLRQLPVEGMDTKWLERHRRLVTALVRAAREGLGLGGDGDLGLRSEAPSRDVLILDRALRPSVPYAVTELAVEYQRGAPASTASTSEGALRHLRVDTVQLAALWHANSARPRALLVCENRQSLLSLPDLTGVVAVHGAGYAVDFLGTLPWAMDIPVVYWGDLDHDGFAILNRLRHHHRYVFSTLMDVETLRAHSALCIPDTGGRAANLTRLTPNERETLQTLEEMGTVRLEQERIAWDWVLPRLQDALTQALTQVQPIQRPVSN